MPAERTPNPHRPEMDMPSEALSSQRVPPQSLEAEMGILGSMALDRDVIGEILQEVRAEHFYRPDHRLIFEVLLSLYEANKPVDLVLLRDELKRRGQLEEVGGVDYLVRLVESVPSAANGVYYARIVRDKGILRDLIRVTGEVSSAAYEDRSDTAELLNEAEQKIFEVTEQTITGQPVQIREVMEKVYELINQRDKGITGLSTGFTELDDLMGGMQRSEMIVVAARPSMGKTALGLNIAEHVGIDNQVGVGIFSLEMSSQQLAERMLCSRGHVDSKKLRQGMLTDEEYSDLHRVAEEISQSPIYVDDSAHLTPL